MPNNKLRIKQIETGEFHDLISGVAAEGYVPYIQQTLENLFVSSETGTFQVYSVPLNTGISGYNLGFNATFNGVPTIVPGMLCPSGRPFISAFPTSADTTGALFAFSSGIAFSGYKLQVIAIDTFLVTTGLASILNASIAGLDLITAPTVALQRQILGVQALNEKNRANGYLGLNSNAQIDTGALPSDFLNWDGGTTPSSGRVIQFKRGARSSLLTYLAYTGEPLYATDTQQLFIGDGVTLGGISVTSGVSFLNVVRTTGNQDISGEKNFIAGISAISISSPNSFATINFDEAYMYDFGLTQFALNWNSRELYDSNGQVSINWNNFTFGTGWTFDGGSF